MFLMTGTQSSGSSSISPPSGADTSTLYTLADIAKHNDASSCWTIINAGVYDLTGWINQHPGGPEAILSICGKDGSAPFNAQHGSAKLQQDILAGYKIGTLSK